MGTDRRTFLVGAGALVLAPTIGGVVFYASTLYEAGPPQRGYLALVGGTLLAGRDLDPVRGGAVLVRDGVIVRGGRGGGP